MNRTVMNLLVVSLLLLRDQPLLQCFESVDNRCRAAGYDAEHAAAVAGSYALEGKRKEGEG